jgi:hypothetical protein
LQITYLLQVHVRDARDLTLSKVDLDALTPSVGDLVELYPNGLRAIAKRRTLLSGLRAFEVYIELPGSISAPHVDELVSHGWTIVNEP